MSKNIFDYSEIRSRVALFVSTKSALSCIRVSKAFSKEFAYPIWHTIDFKGKDGGKGGQDKKEQSFSP
ncbi:hypothetical protein BGZ46_006757, partial [Entomortierella lignicola]